MTKNTQKGFSLVEALVAITVLLVAVVGPMTIASQGLQASFFSREQTTAVYLAQEAIESIEKLRTDWALSGIDRVNEVNWALCQNNVASSTINCSAIDAWKWFNGPFPDPNLVDIFSCKGNSGCDFDVDNGTYIECINNDCILQFDGTSYQHTTVSPSQFTRVIKLEEVTQDQEIRVTVTVSWQANLLGGTSDVVLQTRLFNKYK